MEMKQLILVISIVLIIFMSGCVQQVGLGKGDTKYLVQLPPTDHSYLKDVESITRFVSKNQQFDVNFVVVNPLRQSASHIVEMRYDLPNCFIDIGQRSVYAPANSINATGIRVTTTIIDSRCVGSRVLTVVLMDTNNNVVDFSEFTIYVKSD